MISYQDRNTEINSYGLPKACTDKVTGKPVYDFQEHWLDGYRHYLAAEFTYDGTKYNIRPQIGTYDPSPDGGYGYVDLPAETGMAGKYNVSINGNTIDITVVTKVTEKDDVTCAEGVLTSDWGSPGQVIGDATALTWLNQSVVLPVAVPTSTVDKTTGVDVFGSDIQSVGGLISNSDFATVGGIDAYNMGVLPFPNPDNAGDGPTCPTPTKGGTLPRNPLFKDGQPCQIDNPTGQHYNRTGLNFVF
jgi:hypothetical protein